MAQQIYRHVLRDAWTVTWRHPALWIFGAFALFMGQSQFFYSLTGLFELTSISTRAADFFATTREWFIPALVPNSIGQAVAGFAIALLFFVFLLIFVFMVIQSQGAIMAAGDHIFRKHLFSFKGAWIAALEHFWRILGVLLIKIIAAAVIASATTGLGIAVTHWSGSWVPKVLFVVGFVLLAMADILITFVALYATCYIVLEQETVRYALVRAVRLFTRHWLASLEIGVLFLVLNTLFLIVSRIVFALLFIPLLYLGAIVNAATGSLAPIIFVNLGILFVGTWWVMSVYATWFFMSIVVLFDHMQSDTVVSKVIRWVQSAVVKK